MPDSPEKPPDKPENNLPAGGEQPSVPAKREEEENLEQIIDRLPPEQVQHTLREVIFGIIERGSSGPKIDPEVMKIAAATVEKDNENKFKYLTQKQTDDAAKALRVLFACDGAPASPSKPVACDLDFFLAYSKQMVIVTARAGAGTIAGDSVLFAVPSNAHSDLDVSRLNETCSLLCLSTTRPQVFRE